MTAAGEPMVPTSCLWPEHHSQERPFRYPLGALDPDGGIWSGAPFRLIGSDLMGRPPTEHFDFDAGSDGGRKEAQFPVVRQAMEKDVMIKDCRPSACAVSYWRLRNMPTALVDSTTSEQDSFNRGKTR